MRPLLFFALVTTASRAALVVDLPGNSHHAEWSDLNSTNHAGYPGFFNFTDPWPAPIAANAGSNGSAALNKIAGGGFISSTSVYSFTAPGTFEITQSAPIPGLETIVWQIDHSVEFLNAPQLSFNGGSQSIPADFQSNQPGNFSGNGPVGPFSSEIDAYQWDLSAVAGTITDYRIQWTGGEHQSVFAMGLDESDQFAQAVPQPSIPAMALAALGLLLRRRR